MQGNAAAGPTAMLTMFVGVAILIASLPAGWLTDKFGKKPLIAFSGLLAALGTIIVVLASGMTMLYVGGLLIGIGMGIFYSANWALGTEIVPPMQAGRYLGLSNLAGAGAGAIGAYIGGPIGDGMGLYPADGYLRLPFPHFHPGTDRHQGTSQGRQRIKSFRNDLKGQEPSWFLPFCYHVGHASGMTVTPEA